MTAISLPTPSEPAVAPARFGASERAWRALERSLDRACGDADNPLRQLGALGFLLFWLIAATGIYLYVFFDTSVAGAWTSVERLNEEQPWAGGLMRSLHRYASDAFIVVIVLHLLRELMLGRFHGFRWFSWVSGVPTLWLAVASGVIGYWLVWDRLAQLVAIALTEWFGVLPGFGPSLVRNFVDEQAMTDRMFSLMVFLHIGVPLALLLAMWAHIQRLTRARTMPSRSVTGWACASLLAASIAYPVTSLPPADLGLAIGTVPIDWFYLAPLPAVHEGWAVSAWIVVGGLTVLLTAAPWLVRRSRPAPAVVDPRHCNGCTRCFADCPYAAITMAAHPSGRGQIAVVDDDLCASCGICAGACPSATPFRSSETLLTGIDMPALTVDALRERLQAALAQTCSRPGAPGPIVLFECARAARASADPALLRFELSCAAMIPPAFVDFALRSGAAGVVLASCPQNDCEFRHGALWASQRIRGEREPKLRDTVDRRRVLFAEALREKPQLLDDAISRWFARLGERQPASGAGRDESGTRRDG